MLNLFNRNVIRIQYFERVECIKIFGNHLLLISTGFCLDSAHLSELRSNGQNLIRREIFAISKCIPRDPYPFVCLQGLGNNQNDYQELKSSLEERGLRATILEVSRPDWLRNALGLLDRNYWAGKLTPRPILDWYV